jgi:hypothetical protein
LLGVLECRNYHESSQQSAAALGSHTHKMTAPIIVRFAMSPRLLYRAQVAVTTHSRWVLWRLVFVVGMIPLVLIGFALAHGQSLVSAIRNNLAFIIGFPVCWLVGMLLALRWGAARTLRTSPAAGGDRTFTIDENGILIEGGLSNGSLTWPAIVRVVETRDLVLLFLSSRMAHVIPKDAFATPADLERFRELVAQKVPALSARPGEVPAAAG